MGTVRKVVAALALAGALAAIPLSAVSAEQATPFVKSVQVVANGGQGDWPLAR
ncbi:MAG TPA: hypothetical protein PKN27_02605 [Propionibacteriaceae bacterium]|nr:hypothetical protein [Propionibacteriaceae bacterium]